jgi:hypothetical protein
MIDEVQQISTPQPKPRRRRTITKSAGVPYASASSGVHARDEVTKILRRLGCEAVGFFDDFEHQRVLLQFKHRGRSIQLQASASGWAQMWLRQNPWTYRHRKSRIDYEQDALRQGYVAVNSILRDWTKAQVTAVEAGVFSFDAAFMPHMLAPSGKPLIEHLADQIPPAEGESAKIVALPFAPKPI